MFNQGPGYPYTPDTEAARCLVGIGTLRAEFGIGRPGSSGNVDGDAALQGRYGTGRDTRVPHRPGLSGAG